MRRVAATLVALAAAFALYHLARIELANRGLRGLYIETDLAAARGADEVTRARRGREALAGLESVITHSPLDQLAYGLRGRNAFALGRTEEAEQWDLEALSWGERPELLVALADAQAANGKTEPAIRSLVRVARFDAYMLTHTENAYLRDVALQRYEATSSPEMGAEAYLNMAIGYLTDGFENEAVTMMATGALRDPSILTRREFASWGGYPTWLALQKYAALRASSR